MRHHMRTSRFLTGERGALVALLAIVRPGLLAGLSDDDPAGITTYSILGADFGYKLPLCPARATGALILFYDLAVRMGFATGKRTGGCHSRSLWPSDGLAFGCVSDRREPRHDRR